MSARNKLFVVRVSLEEMEGIRELANALRVTSSEVVRMALREQRKALLRAKLRSLKVSA